MNKLKNIGISALAGTLVSMSAAQAGGVTISGNWELSYTNLGPTDVTGHKYGMNKNLSFGASGDLSDGGGVTWAYSVGGSDSLGLSSASMNINMGGIATLSYDSGTGGYGANAVDNIVPTAWEEVDAGFSTGITDVGRVSSTKGVVTLAIKAPGAGTGFSFSYASRMGAGHQGDGATGGAADANSGNHGIDATLDLVNYSSAHFGLRMGAAAELELPGMTCKRLKRDAASQALHHCGGVKDHPYAGTAYFTTQLGPIHLGTQATFKNPMESAATGILNKRSIVAGAALLIGDTFSISYGHAWDKYRYNDRNRGLPAQAGSGGMDSGGAFVLGGEENEYERVTYRGLSAAINMGPVALKAFRNRTVGKSVWDFPQEHSELNLSIAF